MLATGVLHTGLPRIPEEIEALSQLWGASLQHVPPEDLKLRLQTEPGRAGMLHLAGHGLFEPGHPSFSAVCLGSGFLMAHDIRGLTLDLDLVVLSGCETGRRRRVGGEELLGLPSAWLAAGARAVLGSLWAVEDGDARDAAVGFHENMARGATARQALARTQRALIGQGRDELGWAALSLTGDPDTNIRASGLPIGARAAPRTL